MNKGTRHKLMLSLQVFRRLLLLKTTHSEDMQEITREKNPSEKASGEFSISSWAQGRRPRKRKAVIYRQSLWRFGAGSRRGSVSAAAGGQAKDAGLFPKRSKNILDSATVETLLLSRTPDLEELCIAKYQVLLFGSLRKIHESEMFHL